MKIIICQRYARGILNIFTQFTDNNGVNSACVIAVATILLVLLFPVHVDNYVYFNVKERYLSANVTLYRLLRVFNVNTVKNSIDKMQINGKDKEIDASFLKSNILKIYNNLTLTKIIQLGDYGIAKDGGAYAAVLQNALSQTVYSFVNLNGGRTKLKNYIVLNREHDNIIYYAKVSGVINLIAITKIILILLVGKLNEQI